MLSDLRLAFRQLGRSPGFAAVAILIIAIGIGANTTIFSFFHGILLRPLPFEDPDRLVLIKRGERGFGEIMGEGVGLRTADFLDLKAQARSFAAVTAFAFNVATLTSHGDPHMVTAAVVTSEFFDVLGARAARGRTFAGHETGRLAVLQHALWQNRFGGDPAIIGQSIVLNGVAFTVIGIMPAEFQVPRGPECWMTPANVVPEGTIGFPVGWPVPDQNGRGGGLRSIIGRLAPGVTIAEAESEIAALVARLPNPTQTDRAVHLMSLREQSVGSARPALSILLACVGLVLLIACLNIANLVLARATTRQREIAVRLALGAGRRQIARLLLTESLLLALIGGVAGLLLSLWGVDLLLHIAPSDIPQLAAVRVDVAILAFAFGLSLMTGVASGLAPMLGTGITDLITTMKAGDRGGSSVGGPRRLRALLVSGQVAFSLVLLVAAGLLLRSFLAMQAVSWGFKPENVAVMRVSFSGKKYEDMAQRRAMLRQLLATLSTQPGFNAVATSTDKMGESWVHVPFTVDGFVPASPQDLPHTNFHNVSPGYFQTLGIPLVRGREFTKYDNDQTPQVAIIDASIAQRYFPDGDALGKRIQTKHLNRNAEIVGIVGAVKFDGPEASRLPDIYIPSLQVTPPFFYVYVRTSLDVATVGRTIRAVLRSIDAGLATSELGDMQQSISRPAAARRFPLVLLSGFSFIALVLAAVGIYAVTAYGVVQRTREIGIRMTLGAQARAVTALILRQSLRPIALGIAVGIGGATMTALAMRTLLFGIGPLDTTAFTLGPVLLAIVALLACFLPARRATKVDPLVALRSE